MKFNKKTLSETIQSQLSGKKTFTEGKKQIVIISEEQLERLLGKVNNPIMIESVISDALKLIRKAIIKENLDLNIKDYSDTIMEQGMYDRNPGIAAGEGIENIINGIKKAYDYVKYPTTKKKIWNTLTKLNNFMTVTAELIGSGASQRRPRPASQISKPLPYPEIEVPEELEDIDDDL